MALMAIQASKAIAAVRKTEVREVGTGQSLSEAIA